MYSVPNAESGDRRSSPASRHVTPRLSVIIPCYNRKNVIRATLDSVIAQQPADVEVIVVDDGSTDGTIDVLQEYRATICILRQQNGGPGAARNLGARHATGEYLAFLDSDDLWFPWTATTYTAVIDGTERPAFIAGSPHIFVEESSIRAVAATPPSYLKFADYFASGDEWRWFSASSFVVRRDAFLAVGGFNEQRGVTEDMDLTMRLGTAPSFVQITAPATFAYREHQTSLKANLLTYLLSGQRHVIAAETRGAYGGGAARRRERRRIIARHARPVSVRCIRDGYVKEGISLYASLFWWHAALRRWKYLLGFPAYVVASEVRRLIHT